MIKKIIFLILFSCNSYASAILYSASGHLTQFDPLSFPSLNIGDSWSANLTASNPSHDLSLNNNFGVYQVSWNGFLTIGSQVIQVNNTNPSTNHVISTLNNLFVPELSLQVIFSNLVLVDGIQLNSFRIDLMNTLTSSLSGDDFIDTLSYIQNLPLDASQLVLSFSPSPRNFIGNVSQVSISPSPVPIPSSLYLFGSVLLLFSLQYFLFNRKALVNS